MSTANKLVDKYQYNETQVKQDGLAELITAKHIVLKELFTLKKVCISQKKSIARYHGIMNQMNILKNLGDKPYLFKCHKMLKTSNNLYVVYDLIGKNSTLAKLIQTKQLNNQTKKKNIAIEIMNVLKQLKSLNIFYLDCNPKLIEIDDFEKVKFTNFQNAIYSNKDTISLSFLNVQISTDLAPQLKEIIEDCCALPYEKDIEFSLFNTRLGKVDLYAFGKILAKMFEDQISFSQKDANKVGEFQRRIKKLIQKLLETAIHQRPNFEQIQQVLTYKTKAQRAQEQKNPSIRISIRQRNKLDVIKIQPQMKRSKSLIKSSSNLTNLNTSQNLLATRIEDDFDTKSVRSSANFTDSTTISKIKLRKSKISLQIESEDSYTASYRIFVQKVMKRRNLCKFLLSLANTLYDFQLVDRVPRVMLAFMLVKKSVLLICSLARFISTGKGESEEFIIKENARKEFAKTDDFFRLSVAINKEMDLGRSLYQNMISQLNTEFPELSETKDYNFVYECKSENLNEKFMKQLIKKSISQIVRKLQTQTKKSSQPSKKTLQTSPRPPRSYLHLGDQQTDERMLRTTAKSNKSNNNKEVSLHQIDEITSVLSAHTVKTRISREANQSGNQENFNNDFILRNTQFESLINIYMMGLILDFESYEKMFQNLIDDEKIEFGEQSLMIKLRKMEPKQITQKMADMLQ